MPRTCTYELRAESGHRVPLAANHASSNRFATTFFLTRAGSQIRPFIAM
jgi:hypothetical protein